MSLIDYSGFLADGLMWTLMLSACTTMLTTFLAALLSAGLVQKAWLIRLPCFTIVELLRDIPLSVTVLFTFFAAPMLGVSLDPFWSTVISLSVWGGANGAHIIRAGLASVGRDQREAGASLGIRSWRALRLIVLPQAMPVIIPPYIGLVTSLVQGTSLGALVGMRELLRSAQILIEQMSISVGGNPAFLIFGSILVVYFVICSALTRCGRVLEAYFSRHMKRDIRASSDVRKEDPVDGAGALSATIRS